MNLHRLLARQLKKSGFTSESDFDDPRLQAFIEKVSNTYQQSDEERYTNERVNEISSQEMQDLYKELERSSQSAIKLERDKLNRILMNIGFGLLVLDSDNKIIDINHATITILGCTQEQIINKQFSDLHVDVKIKQSLGTSFATDIATFSLGESAPAALVSFIKTPVDTNNPESGSVVVFHEISETIKQNERLIEARNSAQQANKAKSEFLSRMSHELRTPLHAILGFSQLLTLDKENFSPIQNKNLSEIDKAGNHLLSLINELLDFSRIEAGKVNIDLAEISLAFHLSECVELMMAQARKQDIEIENMVQDMSLAVVADKMRLKQVIINLLSNAIKYNKKGGKVSLFLTTSSDKYLRLTVQDQGSGLDEKEVSQLFRNYERLGETTGVEGTGLGLVITRKLVELMGGTLCRQYPWRWYGLSCGPTSSHGLTSAVLEGRFIKQTNYKSAGIHSHSFILIVSISKFSNFSLF